MKAINLELLNLPHKTPIPKSLDGAMDSKLVKEILAHYEAEKTELQGMIETIRNMNSPRMQSMIMSGLGNINREDFHMNRGQIDQTNFNEIADQVMKRLDHYYWLTVEGVYRLDQLKGGSLSYYARHGNDAELKFTSENIENVLDTVESDLNIDTVMKRFKDNLDNIEVVFHTNGAVELINDPFKTSEYNSKIMVMYELARSLIRHSNENWYALLTDSDMHKRVKDNRSGVIATPGKGKHPTRIKLKGSAAALFREKFNQN